MVDEQDLRMPSGPVVMRSLTDLLSEHQPARRRAGGLPVASALTALLTPSVAARPPARPGQQGGPT